MVITSHQTIDDSEQSDGSHRLTYEFTDLVGKIYTHRVTYSAADYVNFDTELEQSADRESRVAGLELNLAQQEARDQYQFAEALDGASIDKVAVYQPQGDFDRRVIGHFMLQRDCHIFRQIDQGFWVAHQARAGNPPGQRHTYLGVGAADYDAVEDRVSNVQGLASGLTTDLAAVWENLPDGTWAF